MIFRSCDWFSFLPGDETNETLERRILVWRFSKLDLDSNGRLTKGELAGEHRLTILVVKPAVCAKSFHKYCDKNNDKLIDLQEWTTCLKIDFGGKLFPHWPVVEIPSSLNLPTTDNVISFKNTHYFSVSVRVYLNWRICGIWSVCFPCRSRMPLILRHFMTICFFDVFILEFLLPLFQMEFDTDDK